MNRYDELVNWLNEEHNEVFNQWAQIEAEMDEEKRLSDIEKDKKQLEEIKPSILEQVNWCMENKEWFESYIDNENNTAAIMLSFKLMFEAHEEGNLELVRTYQTAIRSITSNIHKLDVIGYLKDGSRVITPFNHCWYHTHKDDVKFDSNTEYDWREEE